MKLPWVSRGLYERVLADLEKSERERREYLDLLISPLRPQPELVPAVGIEEAREAADSNTGVISAAKLRQMAQDAANKRAGKI